MALDQSTQELIFDCFQQPIFEISIIVWDTESQHLCQGMPNLGFSSCLSFAFSFSTPEGNPTEQSLLVTARGGSIRVKKCAQCAEHFSAFMLEYYSELEYCEISNFSVIGIENLYRPFIPPQVDPVWVKRCSLVIRPHEKIAGIFLWLYHGFLLAIVYGYYDETAVLYGEQALRAFGQAEDFAKAGKLTIRTREYECDRMHADPENILNEIPWFDFFPDPESDPDQTSIG